MNDARACGPSLQLPSDHLRTIPAVVCALLTCSGEECTAVYEAYGRLADIEALACECGCGLAIVGWPDEVEEVRSSGEAVALTLIAA